MQRVSGPDRWNLLRRALRLLAVAAALAAVIVATVVVVRAVDARGMPPLEPWHRLVPRGEVTAAGIARMDALADYLEREAVLVREVAATLAAHPVPTRRSPPAATTPTARSILRASRSTVTARASAPRRRRGRARRAPGRCCCTG